MPWHFVLEISVIAVLVVAATVAFLKLLRRKRIGSLTSRGLVIDVASFEHRIKEFRCAISINFGFGLEFWARHQDSTELLPGEDVIPDAYYIRRISYRRMKVHCSQAGLPFHQMM